MLPGAGIPVGIAVTQLDADNAARRTRHRFDVGRAQHPLGMRRIVENERDTARTLFDHLEEIGGFRIGQGLPVRQDHLNGGGR